MLTTQVRSVTSWNRIRAAYGEIAMSQLAQIDMTPEETAVLEREATRLARLLSASEKFTAEAANPPVPGSRMGHARTVDLRDAYDIAGLLILACEDHLRTTLLVLKTGPLPSFALYPLLRAAADAIVRAKHLLDPAISEQTRLARGMNERLDNINQLSKAMAAPGRAHYDQRVRLWDLRSPDRSLQFGAARSRSSTASPQTWTTSPAPGGSRT